MLWLPFAAQVAMTRCSGAHALVLAGLLLAAVAHGQTVLNAPYGDDPGSVHSGLNLDVSTDGIGTFTGRILTSTAASDSTSLLADNTDASGWSDTFTCVSHSPESISWQISAWLYFWAFAPALLPCFLPTPAGGAPSLTSARCFLLPAALGAAALQPQLLDTESL